MVYVIPAVVFQLVSGHLEAAALAQKRDELLNSLCRDPVRRNTVPEFF